MDKLKILDYFIIITSVILSLFFSLSNSKNITQNVTIIVDGEVFAQYSINQNREVIIDNDFGRNVVVIKNKEVYVTESSCEDKIEIKSGKIEKVGQSLVCLPNRLVITLEGEGDTVANTY